MTEPKLWRTAIQIVGAGDIATAMTTDQLVHLAKASGAPIEIVVKEPS